MSFLLEASDTILQRFAEVARQNREKTGRWWKEIDPDINAVDPERQAVIDEARSERSDYLLKQMDEYLSENAQQRRLYEAWAEASKRLEEVSEFEEGQRKELEDETMTAMERYINSLPAQQQRIESELSHLRMDMAVSEGSTSLVKLLDGAHSIESSGMFPGENSPPERKILEIAIPAEWSIEDGYVVMHALNGALKEAGILDKKSCHTGYKIYCDTDDRKLSIITTDEMPELDFGKWHGALVTVGRKLAAAKFKPVRSARGPTYEYETPFFPEDFIENIMHAMLSVDSSVSEKMRLNGRFFEESELTDEEIAKATRVTRISGEAIKRLLVDMIGVQGITPPPAQQEGRST